MHFYIYKGFDNFINNINTSNIQNNRIYGKYNNFRKTINSIFKHSYIHINIIYNIIIGNN